MAKLEEFITIQTLLFHMYELGVNDVHGIAGKFVTDHPIRSALDSYKGMINSRGNLDGPFIPAGEMLGQVVATTIVYDQRFRDDVLRPVVEGDHVVRLLSHPRFFQAVIEALCNNQEAQTWLTEILKRNPELLEKFKVLIEDASGDQGNKL